MPRRERPLGAEDTALLRFAGELRRLRDLAGKPTYRELGKRANYSAAALSEAAGGRKLPSLAVTLAYVRACDGDVERWRRRWREVAADDVPEPHGGPPPYVGLAAYQMTDADLFFGRESVTETLREMLGKRRFVGFFGASGSGKSSVLRAGIAAGADGPVLVITPGSNPVEACAARLAELTGGSATALEAELAADPANLHARVRQATPTQDLLLVVDQFEEVFTLCGAREQDWLITALTGAANAATSRTRVVIGVRADFYGHCARHPELVAALHGGTLLLGPMSPDELRRAITEPAARTGAVVETALVTRLVADVAGQRSALPLVSHALTETWHRRRGLTLSLVGYEQVGGVQHAIARTAEAAFTALPEDGRRAARLLFLRLIALGEHTEDTKRRVPRRQVDGDDTLVDRLAAARLLTLDRDTVELSHEALIRSWPRLRGWLATDRDALLAHHRLTDAADTWEAHDRDPDSLYRGQRLEQARKLRNRFSARECAFLDAAIAAEAERRAADRRQTRRLRRYVTVLVVLALVLAGTATYAVLAQHAATAERRDAQSERAARAAIELARNEPDLAVWLALAAYRVSPTADSLNALRVAWAAAGATPLGAAARPDEDAPMTVGPIGKVAVSYGWNGSSPTLWTIADDVATRRARLPVDTHLVRFSADEGVVLLEDEEGARTHVVDIADPDRPRAIISFAGPAANFVMSEHGTVVAGLGTPEGPAGQSAGSVGVWELVGRSRITATEVAADRVRSIALSTDGRLLAVVRGEETSMTTEIWQVTGPGAPRRLAQAHSGVGDIQPHYSPDGRFLALVNHSTTSVHIVEVSDPRNPVPWAEIPNERGDLTSVRYAQDSRTLMYNQLDSFHLWDTGARDSPRLIATIDGYRNSKPDARYNPETREVFFTEHDGRTVRFDLDDERLLREVCAQGGTGPVDWARHFPGLAERPLCGPASPDEAASG